MKRAILIVVDDDTANPEWTELEAFLMAEPPPDGTRAYTLEGPAVNGVEHVAKELTGR